MFNIDRTYSDILQLFLFLLQHLGKWTDGS